nr:MAG TPA: conotoxin [Ackermannviridae sp.]
MKLTLVLILLGVLVLAYFRTPIKNIFSKLIKKIKSFKKK